MTEGWSESDYLREDLRAKIGKVHVEWHRFKSTWMRPEQSIITTGLDEAISEMREALS